ncbi:MAG: LysM peptidoglycan-binding domain-containing protein [Spirochaetaceae bacterium]|jgi:phage tail protein X|nr:LysM peptidoglycan-binding domain-containing protein [Spirochaetaceae bacterium]
MRNKRVEFRIVYGVICVITLSFALSCATAEAAQSAPTPAPAPVQAAEPEPAPAVESVAAPAPAAEPEPAPVEVAAVPPPVAVPEEKEEEPLAAASLNGLDLSGAKQYKVRYRDTLSKIARKQYGGKTGAFYFPIIFEASKDVLANQDKIIPGTIITIPDLKKNVTTPEAKAVVKPMLLDAAQLYEKRRVHPKTVAALKKEAAKLTTQ